MFGRYFPKRMKKCEPEFIKFEKLTVLMWYEKMNSSICLCYSRFSNMYITMYNIYIMYISITKTILEFKEVCGTSEAIAKCKLEGDWQLFNLILYIFLHYSMSCIHWRFFLFAYILHLLCIHLPIYFGLSSKLDFSYIIHILSIYPYKLFLATVWN